VTGSRAQPLVEHPAREALTSGVTSLIHQAANPYYDWFFGGASAARAAIERQLEAPSSELSTEKVMLLLDDDGTFAGIFVALGGAELAHARKADALATLAAAASPAERSALMARMAETRHLFAPVRADDFYLSKIAVAERLRGRGWGRRLLDEYVAAGDRAGFSRFRLDVSRDNSSAIALYRSAGFAIESSRVRAGLRYAAMTFERPRG
jgi:ribosomal protein S18 acetylase RimI-like enzyme